MVFFRRRLLWLASTLLCCQLSLLTVAPVSLFAHAPEAADAVTCTCVHTGSGQCPMHHPAQKKSGCECRNSTDPDAASIVSLLGPSAVLADTPSALTPPVATKSPIHQIARFTNEVAPPDGPPPRA